MPADSENFDFSNNHKIWTLFDSAHFAISRIRLLEIAQFGLTKEQSQILYIIHTNGGAVTIDQISDFSMRQHHSIYTLINRMIKVGLVRKVKNSKDKIIRIAMTKKGETRYGRLTRDSIEMVFSSLTQEEKLRFATSLFALQKAARNLLGLDHKLSFTHSQSQIEPKPSRID